MKFKWASTLTFGVLVSFGCASTSMNDKFSCGVSKGLGCKSVSEVSQIVDGGYGKDVHAKNTVKARKEKVNLVSVEIEKKEMSRTREKSMSAWFSPYVDDNDYMNDEQMVHFVVDDPKWK